MITLGPADVHVWLTWTDAVAPAAGARDLALLADDERARHDRFHFERDRHVYRVAHALLRSTLSRYVPAIAPADWRFVTTAHGRPELVPATCNLPLRFNISHTRGLAACAVTLAREVGVDVELADAATDPLDTVSHYFAPAEIAALRRLPPPEQRTRFFTLWTLKEAYIKARGLGLTIPLDQFAFDIPAGADAPATIAFTPPLVDVPESWHFHRLQLGPAHFLACAARRDPGESLAVRVAMAPASE